MRDFILKEIDENKKSMDLISEEVFKALLDSFEIIQAALANDKKILICGNGGSAADSQHFAAELTGRYKKERAGLSALALSVDTSALTAIGNDYGYEYVFSRQLEALGKDGDVLFAISTSGNSQNVINAINVAKNRGIKVISLTGKGGGRMREISDINIISPSSDTPRIQENHILFIHILCGLIEKKY